jgi:hypothetical protein
MQLSRQQHQLLQQIRVLVAHHGDHTDTICQEDSAVLVLANCVNEFPLTWMCSRQLGRRETTSAFLISRMDPKRMSTLPILTLRRTKHIENIYISGMESFFFSALGDANRLWVGQAPEIQTMYSLPLSASVIRTRIRQEFERHRHAKNLAAVDILILKSNADYQVGYFLPHFFCL